MLARLLGPHAIGTYTVAYVALNALLTFNELGVSLAVVRWQGDPGEIVPTVTTISMLVSAVIYVGCFFGAPAYADAMGAPAATSVVRVLALLVLVNGFTNTPVTLLQRYFRQGQRTIADQVNVWLGTGVTVALACSGDGAMSLAIGRLAGCTAGAILLAAFAPDSLRLGIDRTKARALLQFGLPLAGSQLIAFAVTSADQFVVGHVLGAVALGFFVLALNLANWPITMFSQPVGNVAPAVFARLQHDRAAMHTTFMSGAGLLCAVALPVCLLIGGSATPLISFVYGARWLPAAQPLLWLALLGAVQIFFLLAYDFLVVLARSRFLLTVQLAWLLALVPALIIGARADGIYGASLAELAVAVLGVLPCYLRELSNVGLRLRALGRHLWLPAAGALFTGLAAVTAMRVTQSDFTALAVSGVVAVAVVGLLICRMRAVLALLRSPAAKSAASSEPPAAESGPGAGSRRSATTAPAASAMPSARIAAADIPEEPSPARGVVSAALARCGTDDFPWYPPSHQDPSATSPLYRITVASLHWDPGNRPAD